MSDANPPRPPVLTLPGDFGLRFSADDTLLGPQRSGGNVRLWRVASGRELHVLRHPVLDGRELLALSADTYVPYPGRFAITMLTD